MECGIPILPSGLGRIESYRRPEPVGQLWQVPQVPPPRPWSRAVTTSRGGRRCNFFFWGGGAGLRRCAASWIGVFFPGRADADTVTADTVTVDVSGPTLVRLAALARSRVRLTTMTVGHLSGRTVGTALWPLDHRQVARARVGVARRGDEATQELQSWLPRQRRERWPTSFRRSDDPILTIHARQAIVSFPPPFSVLWYFVVCVALVSGPSISMWELDVVLTTEWWMSTSL